MIPTSSGPIGSHRAPSDPAGLAQRQDSAPMPHPHPGEAHRGATIHRLPIERISEQEARQRELIETIARSRIDFVIACVALPFGAGAIIGVLVRALLRWCGH